MPHPKKPKEVVANRIILQSPKGEVRASFDATSEGMVSLNLFGSSASLSIGIDSDGNPKINFRNKEGRDAIAIGISDDMGHGITLHDSKGIPVCFILVPEDGIPRIKLYKATSPTRGRKIWETPPIKRKRSKQTH